MRFDLNEIRRSVRHGWGELRAQIKGSHRLQFGLLCIVSIALLYAFLAASDALDAQRRKLVQVQSEVRRVGGVGQRPVALANRAELLAKERVRLERRLGGYATDAIAQAAMAEWLAAALKQLNVPVPSMSQVTVQPLGRPGNPQQWGLDASLRELRTTVAFPYSAAALAGVLSVIEGGERLASVETLNVSPLRVEMGVRLLTRVGPRFSGYAGPGVERVQNSPQPSQSVEQSSAPLVGPIVPTDKILWN